MLSKGARQVLSYLKTREGSYILRQAKNVLNANKIRITDDDRMGIKSLIMASALYPNALEEQTGGLAKSAGVNIDYCKVDTSWCKDNQKIPRFKMPVIEGKFLHEVVRNLQKGLIDWRKIPKNPFEAQYYEYNGQMRLVDSKTPVDAELFKYHEKSAPMPGARQYKVKVQGPKAFDPLQLKPTQSEINFDKSYEMAIGFVSGWTGLTEYSPKTVSLVSKEGFIIDGHHRWAAICMLNRFGEDFLAGECFKSKGQKNCDVNAPDHITELMELITEPGDTSQIVVDMLNKAPKQSAGLTMPVIIIDLPVKELVDCLNACTDSFGIARKPFDAKDKDKVKIPLGEDYNFEKIEIEDEIEGDSDFLIEKDQAEEYDPTDPKHKTAQLRRRLNNVSLYRKS